ncbi:MAG TPA: amidase family protein [Tissierellaceae bacterium]|nr:amidase family protein [Tissierellaceae bacterium]
MDLLDKSISQLLTLMELNEVSSEEITKACTENIEKEKMDEKVYQTFLKDEAIKKAREIDIKRKDKKDLGSLAGIPIAVTDDISTKGILTSGGSKILESYIPPFNATVVDRLNEEDSIILGKLKVNEFGLKKSDSLSETLNSKGAVFGLSTSMDVSKVSMEPTFGLISRYGLIASTSTFDQVVPVTNSVEDLALVLNCLAGYDKRDSASIDKEKVDYRKALKTDIKGLKVAILREVISEDLDKMVNRLEDLGVLVEEISLSTLEYILPVYKVLSSAEFASNSARYDGVSLGYRTDDFNDIDELYKKTRSQGFGLEAKKRILFGNYVMGSGQYDNSYKKSQQIRAMIKEEFTRTIKEYRILLPYGKDEGLDLVANVTGLPSITLAYGIQIVGPYLGEEELINLAYALESKEVTING